MIQVTDSFLIFDKQEARLVTYSHHAYN